MGPEIAYPNQDSISGTGMTAEHFDVVIVGAGLSGIGAAYHLQHKCPGKSYVILEGRDAIGGTWDLFRYPGIRSDSDMHTLGYKFKPWVAEKAIADGPSILAYINATATENGIDRRVRTGVEVRKAKWSSGDATWTVEAIRKDTGQTVLFTCNFLLMCAGYYSYKEGYTPQFNGVERFSGPIVHPQQWPRDLDYTGKRVVIIGSGATAMTLVPSMAKDAAGVVMLQRSPTYVISRPDKDVIANLLRRLLPDRWAYAITRWKNTQLQQYLYRLTRTRPELVRNKLLKRVRQELGADFDVEKHFTPSYQPWDERLCLVPNSDLFKAIRSGKASIVTDHIDTFTESGIQLRSGRQLEADIIITATGLNLEVLGGVQFSSDGHPIEFSKTWTYKGLMYSDVPNLVNTFGYVNASWTLRADLTFEYLCRLLNHMDQTGMQQATPRLRHSDRGMAPRPWIDGFAPGYIRRVMHLFPRQGDHDPWTNRQDYAHDRALFRDAPLEDGVLIFDNPSVASTRTDATSSEGKAAA
jgi:cation diffusion facilitator CzcD-associated flavoprotein CzcO